MKDLYKELQTQLAIRQKTISIIKNKIENTNNDAYLEILNKQLEMITKDRNILYTLIYAYRRVEIINKLRIAIDLLYKYDLRPIKFLTKFRILLWIPKIR